MDDKRDPMLPPPRQELHPPRDAVKFSGGGRGKAIQMQRAQDVLPRLVILHRKQGLAQALDHGR